MLFREIQTEGDTIVVDGRKILERKFLFEKKSVKLEDCKEYIEAFHPEDKEWFYKLCCKPQPLEKNGEPTDEKGLLPFLTIKSKFYEKYFPQETALSTRMKLFRDWNFSPSEEKE